MANTQCVTDLATIENLIKSDPDEGINHILKQLNVPVLIGGRFDRRSTKQLGGAPGVYYGVIMVFLGVVIYYMNIFYESTCAPDNTLLIGPFITAMQRAGQPRAVQAICNSLTHVNDHIFAYVMSVVSAVVFTLVKLMILKSINEKVQAPVSNGQAIVDHVLKGVQLADTTEKLAAAAALDEAAVAQYLTSLIYSKVMRARAQDPKPNGQEVNNEELRNEIAAAATAAGVVEGAQAQVEEGVQAQPNNERPLRRRGRSQVRGPDSGGKPRKTQPTTVFVLGRKRTIVKKPGDRKQYVTVNKKLIPLAKAREMEKKQA